MVFLKVLSFSAIALTAKLNSAPKLKAVGAMTINAKMRARPYSGIVPGGNARTLLPTLIPIIVNGNSIETIKAKYPRIDFECFASPGDKRPAISPPAPAQNNHDDRINPIVNSVPEKRQRSSRI